MKDKIAEKILKMEKDKLMSKPESDRDWELVTALEIAINALEERPKGEWIIIDDTEKFIAKCSVCGRIEDSRMIKDYPFCRCGAKMKGGTQ